MPNIIVSPKFQAIDSAGVPLSGGKLYTYAAGTSTNKATYPTSACVAGTELANPVVLDSRGEATIYGKGYYKLVLKTVEGTYQCDYSEADQGAAGAGNSLKDLIDAIAAENATILFQHNSGGATTTYTLGTSETVPANISLKFENGARISITAGKTLTINGIIEAGDWIIFTSTGTVAGSPLNDLTHAAWFDAGVTDSSTPAGVLKKIGAGNVQGDLLYHNGTSIIRLAPGTVGQLLKTGGAAANPSWVRGPTCRDSYRNLDVEVSAIPARGEHHVLVTATELIVQDTDLNSVALNTVSLNIDLTASGANGLDTGIEAAATWYYVWVIHKPSTATVAGLLSTSGTAPTMPADYTQKALVGITYNDGTGSLWPFKQKGKKVIYNTAIKVSDGGGGTTTEELNLAASIPPLYVQSVYGKVMSNTSAMTWFCSGITFADSTAVDNVTIPLQVRLDAASASYTWELSISLTTQKIYQQTSANTCDTWITGFTLV
jgi:hypothetical protein